MRVTFNRDLIRNGSRYEKGKSYEVDIAVAEAMIRRGIAVKAKETASKTVKPKTRSK